MPEFDRFPSLAARYQLGSKRARKQLRARLMNGRSGPRAAAWAAMNAPNVKPLVRAARRRRKRGGGVNLRGAR